jgi:benzil reductase ((S)-benzoin forming)
MLKYRKRLLQSSGKRNIMRVFIVTGSSRGLGYEICKQLINCNHLIFSIARSNNDFLIELAAQNDCRMHFFKYDLQYLTGSLKSAEDVAKKIVKRVFNSSVKD